MGRIRPGTRLTVRAATDLEIAAQRKRLAGIDCADIPTTTWFVVWADDPSSVLHDWFVPVGGYSREMATHKARRYARARGAEVV